MSEEDLAECFKKEVVPQEEKAPNLYPKECDQSLLREIVKQTIKNPKLAQDKEVQYILERVKRKKRIEEGNTRLRTVLERIKVFSL
jgi:hypothetical protein